MIYNSPLLSPETNLEIAIGEIKFKDRVIQNLRNQIAQLRTLIDDKYDIEHIKEVQYKLQT